MREPGDSDTERGAPNKDSTVELRRSCDYCVRLKRACDGKSPCTLCSRRKKPCTRSARKKSGPAKGTKYAPRRKRSAIAEWADRAAAATVDVGRFGDPGQPPPPHDPPPPGRGGVLGEGMGIGGGRGGRQTSSLSPSLLAGSSMSPMSFLGHSRTLSAGAIKEESPGGSRGRGAPQHHRREDFGAPSASHSPPRGRGGGGAEPFRGEHFARQQEIGLPLVAARRRAPHSDRASSPGGVMGHPRSPRGAGLSAGSLAQLQPREHRQQHYHGGSPSAWTSWEATSRPGLSQLEATAAAAVEAAAAAGGQASEGQGSFALSAASATSSRAPGSFVSMPGASTVDVGGGNPRRVMMPPLDWERLSSPPSEALVGPGAGPGHGGRIQLPSPSIRPYSLYGQNPDERDLSSIPPRFSAIGGSSGGVGVSRSPQRDHRGREGGDDHGPEVSSLSLGFRPSPREPSDPTAGFSFRPSPQLLRWRRSPQSLSRELHMSGRGEPLQYARRGPRGRSLERDDPIPGGGGGWGGEAVGGIGGDDGDRQRRWTTGMQEERGGDVEWRQSRQRLPPPPRAVPRPPPPPPPPYDYHHRRGDWRPYGGGGGGAGAGAGGRSGSGGDASEGRYYSSSSTMAPARIEGRGGEPPDEVAVRTYERQQRADERPDNRALFFGRGGEGFTSEGGGGSGSGGGGDGTQDRRMGDDDTQWRPLDSRHQGRQDRGFEHPSNKRALSPSRQSGEPGAEAPRTEDEQQGQRTGGGGGGRGSSVAGHWDMKERDDRRVRRASTDVVRGSSSGKPSGKIGEAGSSAALRGYLESETPGKHSDGSPASQGSRSDRRSSMEVSLRPSPASASASAQGSEGGGDRQEEWAGRRRGEARIESILSPMALPPTGAGSPGGGGGGGGEEGGAGGGGTWRPVWEGSQPPQRPRGPSWDEQDAKGEPG